MVSRRSAQREAEKERKQRELIEACRRAERSFDGRSSLPSYGHRPWEYSTGDDTDDDGTASSGADDQQHNDGSDGGDGDPEELSTNEGDETNKMTRPIRKTRGLLNHLGHHLHRLCMTPKSQSSRWDCTRHIAAGIKWAGKKRNAASTVATGVEMDTAARTTVWWCPPLYASSRP